MNPAERLLRRLAVHDGESLERLLVGGVEPPADAALLPKIDRLIRLGGLLALAPVVGLARVVSTAPRLAVAIGYDIEDDE